MSVPQNKVIPNIHHLLAVASGKGGVGKSTIALHIALGLQKQGARVGLLDSDIYGPSQPTLLKVNNRPHIENKRIFPIETMGLKTISMGYLMQAKEAVIWRGPMIGMALQQLFFDTEWGELDYLIIDLPPGTGDIPLTMVQKLPITSILMVTTPSALALSDARKAAAMFVRLGVPVIGVIENMASYHCKQCGHTELLFGEGAGFVLAEEFRIPLLAQIPWSDNIRDEAECQTTLEKKINYLIEVDVIHKIRQAVDNIVLPKKINS